jgi:uncharacterized protein
METNYFAKIRKVHELVRQHMPNHSYHNKRHATDVFYAAKRLSKLEGIAKEDRFIMVTAAFLHDIIFVIGAGDNEEKSVEFVQPYLKQFNYSESQIRKISKLILATKMPTHPKNLLEKIICDADLDVLGRKDFFEVTEGLRQEIGVTNLNDWYASQLKFLSNHRYYTASAQKLRFEGVNDNIRMLEHLLGGA